MSQHDEWFAIQTGTLWSWSTEYIKQKNELIGSISKAGLSSKYLTLLLDLTCLISLYNPKISNVTWWYFSKMTIGISVINCIGLRLMLTNLSYDSCLIICIYIYIFWILFQYPAMEIRRRGDLGACLVSIWRVLLYMSAGSCTRYMSFSGICTWLQGCSA